MKKIKILKQLKDNYNDIHKTVDEIDYWNSFKNIVESAGYNKKDKNMENKVLTNESDKEQETPVIEKIDNSKDKDSINDIWMELHLMNIKLGGILKVLDNIIKKI